MTIVLPNDALVIHKTPQDLLSAIATCTKWLKYKKDPFEEIVRDPKNRKPPTFNSSSFINFIFNVPSDYFRVLYPSSVKSE